jgi:hypothetical protein
VLPHEHANVGQTLALGEVDLRAPRGTTFRTAELCPQRRQCTVLRGPRTRSARCVRDDLRDDASRAAGKRSAAWAVRREGVTATLRHAAAISASVPNDGAPRPDPPGRGRHGDGNTAQQSAPTRMRTRCRPARWAFVTTRGAISSTAFLAA